ncbi:unnamed protein product [Chrysodeixis includens]|uniref:Uncharacterized protein n=1 Tax=Chrysodeixis includens TaxID=689277 RepID=A0A9N8PZP6_CHRIL|nr:unnamed protein product [Chrysodeixis includens]
MQRQNSLNTWSSDSETSDCLDVALTKPEDEQLFYTASVHFLRKRLEEKRHELPKPQETTRSCCNLTRPIDFKHSIVNKPQKKGLERSSHVGEGPSLSMHQVLPFPKSSKDSFFTRVKESLRKFRRPVDVNNPNPEETETQYISNYKFPRCARLRNLYSTGLVEISEEKSNENIKTHNVRHSRSSSINILEERKSETNSRR